MSKGGCSVCCHQLSFLILVSLVFVGFLGERVELQGDGEPKMSSSKPRAKRRNGAGGDEKSKIAKGDGDMSTSRRQQVKNSNGAEEQNPKVSELEAKLEAQTKQLWALKDDLKNHVTTAELREMLEANNQDSSGSELDLRDRW